MHVQEHITPAEALAFYRAYRLAVARHSGRCMAAARFMAVQS
jgi:hypothetical protein